MNRSLLISSVISAIGVIGFIAGMLFIGVFSLVCPLVCYLIVYEKFREYFWKSFIIGVVIGLPAGLYLGFTYYLSFVSSPEYRQAAEEFFRQKVQTGPKVLEIYDSTASCFSDGTIHIQVHNPSSQAIKAEEIHINYLEGGCKSYDIDVDEFKPSVLEFESIFFKDCSIGTNTIKITSPNGEDQITLECRG